MPDIQTNRTISEVFNFLSENFDNIRDGGEAFGKFEKLAADAYAQNGSQSLQSLLRANGFVGTHFNDSLILEDCLQALGNLYISQVQSSSNLDVVQDSLGFDKVLAFVPNILLHHITNHIGREEEDDVTSSVQGAAMSIEIFGFTKLATSLCSRGARGLDDLHETLNGFVAHMVNIIHKFGGDVISFEGSSLLCIFSQSLAGGNASDGIVDNSGPSTDIPTDIDEQAMKETSNMTSCLRAVQCAQVLRHHHNDTLCTKIAVSFGDVKFSVLGGYNENWLSLAHGNCVSELSRCLSDAGAQEVVITELCLGQLTKAFGDSGGSQRGPATAGSDLQTCRAAKHPSNYLVQSIPKRYGGYCPLETHRLSVLAATTLSDVINASRLFVAAPVLASICTNTLDKISELRYVTTLSICLRPHCAFSHECASTLQKIIYNVQESLQEVDGFLRKFAVEDGWCRVVIMWGLPLYSYSNNCARALFCAMTILKSAVAMNWSGSAGIATGNVFCGLVGASSRQDYLVIGEAVNVADMLMTKANNQVLIDATTYQHVSTTVRASFRGYSSSKSEGAHHVVSASLSAAGSAGSGSAAATAMTIDTDTLPQCYYEYTGALTVESSMLLDFKDDRSKLVSLRLNVRAALLAQLDKISNTPSNDFTVAKMSSRDSMRSLSCHSTSVSGQSSARELDPWGNDALFTVLVGSAGTGKSTAATYFLQSAKRRNLQCINVQCRPGDEARPFSLVRKIVFELIGIDKFRTQSQQRTMISNIVDKILKESASNKSFANMPTSQNLNASISNMLGLRASMSQPETRASMNINMSEPTGEPGNEGGGTLDFSQCVREMTMQSAASQFQDKAFYDMLCVLLKHRRTVIVIDDAHYCDELSWHQLHNIILGCNLPLSILITTRTQNAVKTLEAQTAVAVSMSACNNSDSQSMSSASIVISEHARSDEAKDGVYGPYSFIRLQNTSYLAILAHANCVQIELTALNENEVGELLQQELGHNEVDWSLVSSVFEFTGGNAFWCNAVAQYIKDHGVDGYTSAICRGADKHTSLNSLILSRFDMLLAEEQVVAKFASIIGDEFSLDVLSAVLPVRLESSAVEQAVKVLREDNMISCVDHTDDIFVFQNPLIRSTLYDLTPPSEVANIHLAVAQYIEDRHATNLWDYYPVLSYHYRSSTGSRHLAVKYTVKSAVEAISQGAFSEGFAFLQAALPLSVSRLEVHTLHDITCQTAKHLCPPTGIKGLLRRMSTAAPVTETATDRARLYADYCQLRTDIETTLDFISKKQRYVDQRSSNGSAKDYEKYAADDEEPRPDELQVFAAQESSRSNRGPPSSTCVIS